MRSVVLINPPAFEPVTLAEAKMHLRVDSDAEDYLITGLITAARQACELECGQVFVPQQWQQRMDTFPFNPMFPSPTQLTSRMDPALYFMRGPVISVDLVTYIATTQESYTLDPSQYVFDGNSAPPRIYPQYGCYWPPTLPIPNAVLANFTAGFVQQVSAEAVTVPATGSPSFTAVLAQAANLYNLQTLTSASGTTFTQCSANPQEGQFSIVNGVLTFNPADAGTALIAAYTYVAVPQMIQLAIKQTLSSWFANRESIVIDGNAQEIPWLGKLLLPPKVYSYE